MVFSKDILVQVHLPILTEPDDLGTTTIPAQHGEGSLTNDMRPMIYIPGRYKSIMLLNLPIILSRNSF